MLLSVAFIYVESLQRTFSTDNSGVYEVGTEKVENDATSSTGKKQNNRDDNLPQQKQTNLK